MSVVVIKETIELAVRGKLNNYINSTQLGCLRQVLVTERAGTKVSISVVLCRFVAEKRLFICL